MAKVSSLSSEYRQQEEAGTRDMSGFSRVHQRAWGEDEPGKSVLPHHSGHMAGVQTVFSPHHLKGFQETLLLPPSAFLCLFAYRLTLKAVCLSYVVPAKERIMCLSGFKKIKSTPDRKSVV